MGGRRGTDGRGGIVDRRSEVIGNRAGERALESVHTELRDVRCRPEAARKQRFRQREREILLLVDGRERNGFEDLVEVIDRYQRVDEPVLSRLVGRKNIARRRLQARKIEAAGTKCVRPVDQETIREPVGRRGRQPGKRTGLNVRRHVVGCECDVGA